MSRKRAYKEETTQIITRFFEAVDILIVMKKIRGIQTYCNLYEIDKRNFYAQKKDIGKGYFEVQWILPLIQDFNICSDWILFGKGKMFKPE